MEVVCGRCKADYEFDDTLISARGTMVRCTNCGLQFKVFSKNGQELPEEWAVTTEGTGVVHRYGSLADLQRAITVGDVEARDSLSRGGETPRALSEIAEFEPLFRKRLSQTPPPLPTEPRVQIARVFSSTQLGMPIREEYGELRSKHPGALGPPPLATSRSSSGPTNRRSRKGSGSSEKRRVRSALSNPLPGIEGEGIPFASDAAAARAGLPSLTSTLIGRPPFGERPSSSFDLPGNEANEERVPSPPELEPVSTRPAFPKNERTSEDVARGPTAGESPIEDASRGRMQELGGPDAEGLNEPESVSPAVSSTRPTTVDSVPPPASILADVAGTSGGVESKVPSTVAPSTPAPRAQRTPSVPVLSEDVPVRASTPMEGVSARPYQIVSRQQSAGPQSSVRGESGRRARGVLFVAVIAAGGVAFALTAGRERVQRVVSDVNENAAPLRAEPPQVAEPQKPTNALTVRSTLVRADLLWLRLKLLEPGEMKREQLTRQLNEQLETLKKFPELSSTGAPSWDRVDALRLFGQSEQARAVVAQVAGASPTPSARATLSLGLLDLAQGDAAPFALVADQFEQGPGAEPANPATQVALLYALAQAGRIDRARTYLEERSAALQVVEPELVEELEGYLARIAAAQKEAKGTLLQEPSKGHPSEPREKPAEVQSPNTGTAEATPRQVRVSTPLEKSATADASRPAAPVVTDEVQGWVDAADSLWISGEQARSVELYKKVLSAVGPAHFLGQRSSARIRQASSAEQ